MQNSTDAEFPALINLGIIRGACPCACVHCPVGREAPEMRRERFGQGAISPGLFRQLCREIAVSAATVRLHGVGEPTLHPQFIELLEIIRELELVKRFWLFTCGLVPSEMIDPLLESLGIIEVSLNAVTSDEYLRTKGGNHFAVVVRNIELLQERALQRDLPVRILLSRVASGSAADDAFVEHWRGRGFESFVRSYHSYSGILEGRDSGAAAVQLPKCLVPWRRFNLDGTLRGDRVIAVNCFNVLFQHPSAVPAAAQLGSFPPESLKTLWNNAAFRALRGKLNCNAATGTNCDQCSECLTAEGPRSEGILSGEDLLC